jgi:hypothetical protein
VTFNNLQRLVQSQCKIGTNQTDEKTKVQTSSLAKECVINKPDLLINVTVIDIYAIRFVSEKS